METLFVDFTTFIKNNWKIILILAVVLFLGYYYPDIKAGIADGWMNH